MRFFITCLLLFCFQSFVVCTVEDGSITFAQDFNLNSNQTKLAKIVAKQSFVKHFAQANYQLTDISNCQLSKHLSIFINFLNKDKLIFIKHLTRINKVFKNQNHNYSFIFKCLYPKHTFW